MAKRKVIEAVLSKNTFMQNVQTQGLGGAVWGAGAAFAKTALTALLDPTKWTLGGIGTAISLIRAFSASKGNKPKTKEELQRDQALANQSNWSGFSFSDTIVNDNPSAFEIPTDSSKTVQISQQGEPSEKKTK